MTSVSDAGKATSKAMKRVMNESLDPEDLHVVLPDENLECLAEKYGVSKRDLIRVNSLNRRSLRAGQELIIPHAGDIHEERIHPHEILVMNATNEHDQVGWDNFQVLITLFQSTCFSKTYTQATTGNREITRLVQ